MSKYLLWESQDPFQSKDTLHDLALSLKSEGHTVVYLLVENGVFPARKCSQSSRLETLCQAGVRVCADDFSLDERGIHSELLVDGVEVVNVDKAFDFVLEGYKSLWS